MTEDWTELLSFQKFMQTSSQTNVSSKNWVWSFYWSHPLHVLQLFVLLLY